MEHRQNGDQHIGIVLNAVQVEVVLVIVVGAFVAVQVVLELRLHTAVSSLRRQHFLVLGWVGSRAHRARPGVAKRHQGGRTGLHHKEQEHTGQGQHHPHGMPLHKAHRFCPGLFRGGGCLFAAPAAPVLTASRARFWYCFFKRCLRHIRENRVAGHFRVLLGGQRK